MGFNVEMTGRSDYYEMIKMAVVGMAGAGKTLLSSTAPDPLFVFFREQPRIMSIANRAMPHVKVLPSYDDKGKIVNPVEDVMLEVLEYLKGDGSEFYQTVIIDTGDELQKALKEGKKNRNRGKWGISDWGWLADEYYTVVNAFIDLPMNVIVTYHLKNTQEGEDGTFFKEIALQGAAKDDSPGWFDVVGVLDTFENVDDKGVKTTARGFLTSPTPRYGWVKDHSGQLPSVFEISKDFVGDFGRINDLIYGKASGANQSTEHEIISVVQQPSAAPAPVIEQHAGIPTQEEVTAKKAEAIVKEVLDAEEVVASVEQSVDDKPDTAVVDINKNADDGGEVSEGDKEDEPPEPEQVSLLGGDNEPEEASTEEDAEGDTVDIYPHCEVCGEVPVTEKVNDEGEIETDDEGKPVMVVDSTLVDLSKVRFRKVLCQTHLLEARAKA